MFKYGHLETMQSDLRLSDLPDLQGVHGTDDIHCCFPRQNDVAGVSELQHLQDGLDSAGLPSTSSSSNQNIDPVLVVDHPQGVLQGIQWSLSVLKARVE